MANYAFLNWPGCTKELEGYYQSGKVIPVDTETQGLDPRLSQLLLVQMMDIDKDMVHVIDFRELNDEDKERLTDILLSSQIILHNAEFDLRFLFHNLPTLDINALSVFDTQVIECVVKAGIPVNPRQYSSLANVCNRRLGVKMSKEARSSFINHVGPFSQGQIDYAVEDVVHMAEIRRQQIREAKELGLEDVVRLENELVKHVAMMEYDGVRVDSDKWRAFIKEQKREYKESYDALVEILKPGIPQNGLFGEISINVDSQSQLLGVLNNGLGLELPDTTEFTLSLNPHPACRAILDYREHAKILAAFGLSVLKKIHPMTGRLHPAFNQALTATGRFSSDNPNVQQIPSRGEGSKLRECFVPGEGFKFTCADYSQIELRILAEFSGERNLIDSYINGEDIHTRTASIAFGTPIEDVTSDQRKIAKILNFGICYGAGPQAVTKGLLKELSEEQAVDILKRVFGKKPGKNGAHYTLAKEFIASYFKNLPDARDWLQRTGDLAVTRRMSVTPMGRVRIYDDLLTRALKEGDEKFEEVASGVRRKGMNHPIQGCSADITKIAMVGIGRRFNEELGHENAHMLLQVHDEIICEVKEEFIERAMLIQKEEMEKAAREFLKQVPVTVDVMSADYWTK